MKASAVEPILFQIQYQYTKASNSEEKADRNWRRSLFANLDLINFDDKLPLNFAQSEVDNLKVIFLRRKENLRKSSLIYQF